jgi:S-sulfo-L-cysteine synthase (O-acetyl-L-serine-dependent)
MVSFLYLNEVMKMNLNQIHATNSALSPATGLEIAVGNTPLLPLNRITATLSRGVQIFAKAEWFNPGGSVKDRPALHILRSAIQAGELAGGRRLLDSTSGNMGIAYATFGASLGIPVTLVMPANAGRERTAILNALGAELIFSDPTEGSDGAIQVASEMARLEPQRFFFANQYNNPANWRSHFLTTGPEIAIQTGGRITHFIAGLGTTGTMVGAGRYLVQQVPGIRLIGVQPDSSFHGLEGLKHLPSALVPGIYDPDLVGEIVEISTESAYQMVLRLAREEGLFVGISSGAAAYAAMQLAAGLDEGVLVAVFPDAGYKYLSDKELWEG